MTEIRTRQCRVPTILFWVGTRHCLGLYPGGAWVEAGLQISGGEVMDIGKPARRGDFCRSTYSCF